MSGARRLATLVAFATVAAQRGQDDALEHFDRLHGELQLRVRKQGERERLRDGREIDRAGLTLVDACRALLAAAPHRPVADAVFARVDRAGLADAVAAMERLARAPEERARDLILTRYGAVRRYLPLLLDTLDLHATDAGEPILDALDALQRTAGQRRLTPRELPTELIPRQWRRLVEPEPGRLDRAAYTMFALEALRDGLRRRDVYVARSERYGDPRASLLDAPTWNASRSDVCRSLSLPEAPEPFITRLGAELDAAYRRTLEGLHADHPLHELAAGRLPVEQLDALPEPSSLLALRDRVDRRLPDGDLPDLLLLALVVNCIALYNTIYTQRALDHLTATGHAIRDEDIERLSPLGHDHITLTGRYRIALPDPLRDRAAYRPHKAPPPDTAAA